MSLTEVITWAIVEINSSNPHLDTVAQALESALIEAARLSIKHDVRETHLLRMARAWGDL